MGWRGEDEGGQSAANETANTNLPRLQFKISVIKRNISQTQRGHIDYSGENREAKILRLRAREGVREGGCGGRAHREGTLNF